MELSPIEMRIAELDEWRVQVIRELRQLAELLASTSRDQIPTPDIGVSVYSVERPADNNPYAYAPLTPSHVRAAMAASPGNWRKTSSENRVMYVKCIGDTIRYYFYVSRSTTCRQVEVGTKVIPAEPEREVKVYEWQCDTPDVEV
jgi:hypothetical protein